MEKAIRFDSFDDSAIDPIQMLCVHFDDLEYIHVADGTIYIVLYEEQNCINGKGTKRVIAACLKTHIATARQNFVKMLTAVENAPEVIKARMN